jgi:hypothetical protein
MTHEHSAIQCPICGKITFDTGEVEYFVDVRILRNFDIDLKECESHKNE